MLIDDNDDDDRKEEIDRSNNTEKKEQKPYRAALPAIEDPKYIQTCPPVPA